MDLRLDAEPTDAPGLAGCRCRSAKSGGRREAERTGIHVPRLAVLLHAPRHAGDGVLESRPVAGGILRSASGETGAVGTGQRAARATARRHQSGAGYRQRLPSDGRSAMDCRVHPAA